MIAGMDLGSLHIPMEDMIQKVADLVNENRTLRNQIKDLEDRLDNIRKGILEVYNSEGREEIVLETT